MKTKKKIFLSSVAFICSMLFSISAIAQADYDDILENVENTESYDVMQLAEMEEEFSTFVELLELARLDEQMEFAERFTIFIPTNDAFEEMPKERFNELKNPQNRTELVEFLKRHILPTEVAMMEFNEMQVIETAQEEYAEVSTEANSNIVFVGGAEIVKPGIVAADGLIHVVNGVIMPTEDLIMD